MIDPKLLEMLGEGLCDAPLAGNGKMVYCYHPDKNITTFAGCVLGDLSGAAGDDWRLAVGGLLVVPNNTFKWKAGQCGWLLSRLITEDGLDLKHWKADP